MKSVAFQRERYERQRSRRRQSSENSRGVGLTTRRFGRCRLGRLRALLVPASSGLWRRIGIRRRILVDRLAVHGIGLGFDGIGIVVAPRQAEQCRRHQQYCFHADFSWLSSGEAACQGPIRSNRTESPCLTALLASKWSSSVSSIGLRTTWRMALHASSVETKSYLLLLARTY